MIDKTTNDSHDTFVVNIKHEWHKLGELKTLEEVLRVFNALEISFMSDKVEKYNLHDLIETSPQDTPAIEINPNPKGIDVWKDLYERYKLTQKEREEVKEYRDRIDRDNKQYFPKKDI
jgi:Zn-finger nucleic acid-binding protein